MKEEKYEILSEGQAEIVRKKSRFIGRLLRVTTEEEALSALDSVRKEHYNARHNCFAYIIPDPKVPSSDILRSSDDGEPSQTAGKQIADALTNRGLCNALLVVTRYFGGVLLGTGGLSQAYRDASLAAIDAAGLAERHTAALYTIESDYNDYGKIDYLLRARGIDITATDFGTAVTLTCLVPEGVDIARLVNDCVAGRAALTAGDEKVYCKAGKDIIFF